MSIITFANQKGGVGKTMTVAATASVLVQEGYKVLLIDLDAQRNLDMVAGEFEQPSLVIPRNDSTTLNIIHVLKGECTLKKAIIPSAIGDLVRSSNNLYGWTGNNHLKEKEFLPFLKEWDEIGTLLTSLNSDEASPETLKKLKESYEKGKKLINPKGEQSSGKGQKFDYKLLENALKDVKDEYDFILIDTNPSLTLLTLNALYACEHVVIPTFPEASSMEAIMELSETVEQILESEPFRNISIAGVLMTKYSPHRKKSKRNAEILKELVDEYLGAHLFKVKIRDTERASEYVEANLDIVRHDPTGNTAMDYREFVKELKLRVANVSENEGRSV